jgi:SAM-dependent methyltransferase
MPGAVGGDVSLLVADLVGPSGIVVGVDNSVEALEAASQRAAVAGFTNVTFVRSNLQAISCGESFDALVGRFVLMHLADPVGVLHHLASLVRPGGLVVFQESDLSRLVYALPMTPLMEKFGCILSMAGARVGAPEQQMGLKLYPTFLKAGLPAPRLRMNVPLGAGPDFPGYELLAGVIRSLLSIRYLALPRMQSESGSNGDC